MELEEIEARLQPSLIPIVAEKEISTKQSVEKEKPPKKNIFKNILKKKNESKEEVSVSQPFNVNHNIHVDFDTSTGFSVFLIHSCLHEGAS